MYLGHKLSTFRGWLSAQGYWRGSVSPVTQGGVQLSQRRRPRSLLDGDSLSVQPKEGVSIRHVPTCLPSSMLTLSSTLWKTRVARGAVERPWQASLLAEEVLQKAKEEAYALAVIVALLLTFTENIWCATRWVLFPHGLSPASHSSPRKWAPIWTELLLFSRSIVSDSLQPRGLQHARPPCPSLSPRACSNSCPLNWWCHPTISSSTL